MSTEKKSRLPNALRRAIDRYRRRWRVVYTHTGLLVTVAVVAGTVGAAVAADRLLRLSPVLRAVALGAIVVAGAVCLARWVVWPAVRRLSDHDAAARLGRHFPKVEEDLVSAVELSGENFDEQGISHGLVESALRQIADRARTVDPRAAVPVRPLLKAGAAVAVLVVLLAGAYAMFPEAIANALTRLFRPAAAVPYFCYTKLAVEPGDRVARVGDAVDIVITTTGRPAATARLYGRKGDGSEPADAVSVRLACQQGVARWNTGPLFKDLRYRVAAGDALSQWHRIRVVPPPSLSKKSAVLTLPEYAGSRQRRVESIEGALQVVEGTQVALEVVPVSRGREPEFQCRGEARFGELALRLAPNAAGALVSEPFVPTRSGECEITLTDGFGLTNRTPELILIRVAPDRVPVVNIAKPGRDVLALPGERVPLAIAARDEFGIRSLVLATRTLKQQSADEAQRWQRRTLKKGSPAAATLEAAFEIVVDRLGLAPGDTLEYKAEATDYADNAALRKGSSPVYRVVVLSELEHLERILSRLKELQLEMLRRAATQRAQSAEAKRLAQAAQKAAAQAATGEKGKETAKPPKGKEPRADDAEARRRARTAHERQAHEARATEHLARKLESLIPQLARNPSTPTRMLAGMEQLGRGVRQTANGEMQNAADQFARAAQGQQGRQGEPSPLRIAQESTQQAARRLEQLAQLADRMQRRALLEKLAAEAEALATRQRELKDNLLPLAKETLGTDPDQMTDDQKGRLRRITAAQKSIKDGVENLGNKIEKAAGTLAFSSPSDAAAAEEAKLKLDEDKVAHKAAAIARRLAENALFSQLPEQEKVAKSLLAVAAILRRSDDDLEAFMRELDEFIRRQKAINAGIEAAIAKAERAKRPGELGSNQATLQRDVSEQASALHWLAEELAAFRSQTAARLDAAAKEMGEGATDLFAKALPEGLEHGKRALALLEDAREQLSQEMPQMQQAMMTAQMMRALLLLQRCLVGQKRVNSGTIEADALRARQPDAFDQQTASLAIRQSRVRMFATRLARLLAQFPGAAALVKASAGKMNVSRIALGAGDTGRETRQVQRQALALLEKLLQDAMGGGMGGAMAGMMGARAQAMMGMMGRSPGGFAGGTNAPIMPANPSEARNEQWRRARSRFGEQLGAAFEANFPARYRDLLNAYFDRLRKEPIH